MTNAVLSEARILVAGLKSIARRPLQPVEVKPGWRSFGTMQTSSYGNAVSVLLLIIAVEAPALHLILGAALDDGALRETIRGLLLGSSLYLALWLIGDLRLLRETPGVLLGNGVLAIEMGSRVNGQVALEAVTGARALDADDAVPPDGSRAIRITSQPRPNCRIQLRSSVSMRGLFGAPLRGNVLDVYVDDPAALVAAIETAIAASKV